MNSWMKRLMVGITAVGAAAFIGCSNRAATAEGTGGSGQTEEPTQTPPDPGQDTTEYPGQTTDEGSMGGADTGMPEGPGTPSDATPSDNTGMGGSGTMGEEGAVGADDDVLTDDPVHTDEPPVEPVPGTDDDTGM